MMKALAKTRSDFIDYMDSLTDRSTYNYLSLESEGERVKEYREKHINASRKVFAIEEAYAPRLAKAVKELSSTRNLSNFSFSNSGKKQGFTYDFNEQLVPEKSEKHQSKKAKAN